MFSEDESQVVLLDYQVMSLAHPAKDIWYFLSVASGDFLLESGHCNLLSIISLIE